MKRVRPARIGRADVQLVEYAFNPIVQLARSGLCTGERQAALELVRAKMRGRPAPAADGPEGRAERDKVVRRLVGMLGRKGYGPGLAFGVVKEVLGELDG